LNEAKDEMETVSTVTFRGIYPDVDLERALFLTDQYLFDLYWLSSGKARQYDWHVCALGNHKPLEGQAWNATSELNGSMLYREYGEAQPEGYQNKRDGNDLIDVRKMTADASWSTVILQDNPQPDNPKPLYPSAWYEKQIGVRIAMLPEADTTIFAGRPPVDSGGMYDGERKNYPEPGATALMVRRVKAETVFAALHEPFQGGAATLGDTRFEQLAATPKALAVRISNTTQGLEDRLLLTYGSGSDSRVELNGEQESFAFTSYGFVRCTPEQVQVYGQIHALRIPVKGTPKLSIDGKETPARIQNGVLSFSR
jgi:hypothetical protein